MRIRIGSAAILAAMFCTACSDGRPDRVPISGQVLIDGKPLTYGYIRFVPTGGRASRSKLDADGRFSLGCFEQGDGAIIGQHRVEVSGLEPKSDWEFCWHAPKKYASYETSGLTVDVTEPTDSQKIELSWDGGAPFIEIDESAKSTPVSKTK